MVASVDDESVATSIGSCEVEVVEIRFSRDASGGSAPMSDRDLLSKQAILTIRVRISP